MFKAVSFIFSVLILCGSISTFADEVIYLRNGITLQKDVAGESLTKILKLINPDDMIGYLTMYELVQKIENPFYHFESDFGTRLKDLGLLKNGRVPKHVAQIARAATLGRGTKLAFINPVVDKPNCNQALDLPFILILPYL